MKTPVWVITGLLDSGKTTLINRLIKEELRELNLLILQFEAGEELVKEGERIQRLMFSKSQLEQTPLDIADGLLLYLEQHSPDLLLIEWNGMEHFHTLEKMLLQFSAKAVLCVEKVVYVVKDEGLLKRLWEAGPAARSQIEGSDFAYIRTKEHKQNRKIKDILHSCNPDIRIFTVQKWERFLQKMVHFSMPAQLWFLMALMTAIACITAFTLLKPFEISMGRFISIFLGVFLQAVPFLAIGVLLSSVIQFYLPQDWIQRRFPKTLLSGQLFAVLAGFCLPVCDCASIPVFKSLVKKGVPMPAAVTFMLVSPVINPVVILSTWYAFNGNYRMLAARCGLGILCAVLCGLTYLVKPPEANLAEDETPFPAGCRNYSLPVEEKSPVAYFLWMLRHGQSEFFSVGKYLLIGIAVSALFQDMLPLAVAAGRGTAPWAALLLMMGMSFALSLCSSSDAVVARSMAGGLPAGSIVGFLVFGPMMDIKNAAMLLSGFKPGFVARLSVTTFLVCFIVVLMFMLCGSGGIRI